MKSRTIVMFMGSSFRISALFAVSATVLSIAVLFSPLTATETEVITPAIAGADSMTPIANEQTPEAIETMNQVLIPAPITPTGTVLPPIPAPAPHVAPRPVQTPQPKPAKPSTAPSHPAPTVTDPGNPYPARLIIPSIGLNVPIQGVGVNSAGEMAVPSASSGAVGWYKNGTIPGYRGTAVLDAHVFAAFKELDNLKVGSDIYVQTEGGAELHFVARQAITYPLSELTSDMLFGSDGEPRLNLITCAGKLTSDHSTYDHRLVVYAVLAN